ncbi:hypothetical protein EDD15DRAFT_2191633 [Pisolithus albus]|nr:hypothetical protein EDD15DRAFT_2191633 [Pisolithus albus]
MYQKHYWPVAKLTSDSHTLHHDGWMVSVLPAMGGVGYTAAGAAVGRGLTSGRQWAPSLQMVFRTYLEGGSTSVENGDLDGDTAVGRGLTTGRLLVAGLVTEYNDKHKARRKKKKSTMFTMTPKGVGGAAPSVLPSLTVRREKNFRVTPSPAAVTCPHCLPPLPAPAAVPPPPKFKKILLGRATPSASPPATLFYAFRVPSSNAVPHLPCPLEPGHTIPNPDLKNFTRPYHPPRAFKKSYEPPPTQKKITSNFVTCPVALESSVFQDTHSTMARTKQTARKTTGDKAPRVSLQSFQKRKGKASAASKRPTPKQKASTNSFCVMCRDGGDLWICNEKYCRRVVCNKCLVVPEEEKDKLTQDGVTFKCVTCHWRENQTNPQPYFGFYSEGIPILAHPPVVQGSFQHAISSQVASLPTALVHLHMDNLEVGHAQVNIMNSYLQPYFPQGSYQFSQLPFNLATQESLHDYEKAAMDLAHSLSSFSRVVLFLTTHSDEERGDLFSGEVDGKPIASKVSECLQVLFHPLTKIVKGADVIFNVCGSVVTVQDSFDDLKEAAHKFMPRSMIFFDAQHLQLATTTPYLLSLLESIVIQGFDIAKAVKFALNDCALLGRHSNIITMMWRSEGQGVEKVEKVVVEKLMWTDKHIRPWGGHLPVQCPQCGTMQKWECGSAGMLNVG